MQLIDGRLLAEKIKDEIVFEVQKLDGARPNLAIVLVGDREDSKIYVGLKEKQAKLVGVDTHTYNCEAEIAEEDLINVINYLNNDEQIDAILLQLPLPEHLDESTIVATINPDKDVDGFHPVTLKKYFADEAGGIEPVLPTVVREILASINFDGDGKVASVVANSEIFGETMRFELEKIGLSVELLNIEDKNLTEALKQSDLVVTAVGRSGYLTKEMIKDEAVVVDIGISKNASGSFSGDANQESFKDKPGYLTPVPGGVGPITIAVALRNTLRLHQQKNHLIEIKEETV